MISSKNFTFIAIPKTGTRAVYKVLKTKTFRGKECLKYEHHTDVPSVYKEKFIFTTVRNPYQRICSAFWAVKHGPTNFKNPWMHYMKNKTLDVTLENYLQCVKDNFGIENYDSSYHHPGIRQSDYFVNIKYDKVLKLENLDRDFSSLPFVRMPTMIPATNTQFVDVHKEKLIKNLLTPNVIKLVNDIYRSDFKMFGYDMIKE